MRLRLEAWWLIDCDHAHLLGDDDTDELSLDDNNSPPAPVAPQPVVASLPPAQPIAVRHEWYQSGTYVSVSILQKKLAPEDVVVTIEPKKVRASMYPLLMLVHDLCESLSV